MSEGAPENPPLDELERRHAQLQRSFRALQRLIQAVLVALILMCGSLSVYLFRQVSTMRKQVEANRPLINQTVADYNSNYLPQVQQFLGRLQAFARTNADFAPILSRYSLAADGVAPAAPPPSAPPAPTQK
ncbi:MAG: hypothetical protein AB1705_09855 [Verrucomicrobiota bacterium]